MFLPGVGPVLCCSMCCGCLVGAQCCSSSSRRPLACGASCQRRSRVQLVQRFGKISARKPRYPTTRTSFLRVIAGCFSVVVRIPRSGPRSIRERRTARAFPVGYLGFRAKICLGGCTISDSPAIPIRKSNLPFRAFALPVYYRKRPLMAIALQFFVCLAISMLPRVSR